MSCGVLLAWSGSSGSKRKLLGQPMAVNKRILYVGAFQRSGLACARLRAHVLRVVDVCHAQVAWQTR